MVKLSVPSTVKPQHAENYLDTLSALLRARYGGNTVKRANGTYYDNANYDMPNDPQAEQAMYEDMIYRA